MSGYNYLISIVFIFVKFIFLLIMKLMADYFVHVWQLERHISYIILCL